MFKFLKITMLAVSLFLAGADWNNAQAVGDRVAQGRAAYHGGGYGYHAGWGAYYRPYQYRRPYRYGYHRPYPYRVHYPYYGVRPYPYLSPPLAPFPFYPGR